MSSPRSRSSSVAPRRFLVVDDSDDDAAWIQHLLGAVVRAGDTVVRASTLADAATECARVMPDLVLADYSLPDGDGAELADQLRDECPVIVMTGQETPGQGEELIARGAIEFLVKDHLDPSLLARAVLHAFQRHRMRREVVVARAAERDAIDRDREARAAVERALEDERRARSRLAILLELSKALTVARTVAQAATAVTPRLREACNAHAVSFYAVRDDVLELVHQEGFEAEAVSPWRSLPVTTHTAITDAVTSGQPRMLPSAAAFAAVYGHEPPPGFAWLAVPCAGQDGVVGVLGAKLSEGVPLDADAFELVSAVAGMLGQAVERARMHERAEASAAFEERMMAVLGHDLRSPLEVVSLSVAVLRAQGAPESTVSRIERATGSMRDLIADVMRRATARHVVVDEAERFGELAAVVEAQVEELRDANPARSIQLVARPGGGAAMPCDRVKVAQVVSNLVRNALQHGDPRHPVEVSLAVTAAGGTLAVRNRGDEISEAHRARLFEPFVKGRRSQGSGLGLFIVHETVVGMGGHVFVESAGGFNEFRVTLPRQSSGSAPHLAPVQSGPHDDRSR